MRNLDQNRSLIEVGGIKGSREDYRMRWGLGTGLSPDARGQKSLGRNEAKGTGGRVGFVGV